MSKSKKPVSSRHLQEDVQRDHRQGGNSRRQDRLEEKRFDVDGFLGEAMILEERKSPPSRSPHLTVEA